MTSKRFGGFTPEQNLTLLKKLGYKGSNKEKDITNFLAASPQAAAKLYKWSEIARQKVEGKPLAKTGMSEGGLVDPQEELYNQEAVNQAQARVSTLEANIGNLTQQLAVDPSNTELQNQIADLNTQLVSARAGALTTQQAYATSNIPHSSELHGGLLNEPSQFTTQADVASIQPTDDQLIAAGTGQVTPVTPTAVATPVTPAAPVSPVTPDTATVEPKEITPEVTQALTQISAATGTPTADALATAATMDANQLAQLGLSAEQITQVQQVVPTTPQTMTQDQIVEAAKADVVPTAQEAQSNYQSTVQAIQGVVGAGELVDVDTLVVNQAVEAIAASANGLDQAAITAAVQGTLSSNSIVVPEQGVVDSKATVQGQLGLLMQQFNNGTPSWAAGAMRAANAAMNARGLGASSMAASAIVQAAMESAMPIAQQDAATFANMGLANLNNRQQAALANAAASQNIDLSNLQFRQKAALQNSANAFALQSQNLSNEQAVVLANAQFKAALQEKNLSVSTQVALTNAARVAEVNNINLSNQQQAALQRSAENLQVNMSNLSNRQQTALANLQVRSAILGQELTHEQQARTLKASRIAEIANMNFTAEQQSAIENARLSNTIDIANLDARQAKLLADVATMSQVDITNLNNRQQAAVQSAQAFLEMDLTNVNNEQQKALFDAQARVNSLLSDQAAINAAAQFNATSENQTNQFFANLSSELSMFNVEQQNIISTFNADEANGLAQFNATLKDQRDKFNAQNSLVVAQANAQWLQTIATAENAEQNEANRLAALAATNFTQTAIDNLMQAERDLLHYAFTSAESAADRDLALLQSKILTKSEADRARGNAVGTLLGTLANGLFNNWGAIFA